ncbi:hypothetical protein P3T42_007286 [Paraburkholderia sp. GAS38]|uniref:rolling circle replication-associated protein n=1 Tax=Paraburkholderia sp. GAS38 TaxID=3035133 RepID=UPI003D2233D6
MANKSHLSRLIAEHWRRSRDEIRLDRSGLVSRASLFFAHSRDAQAFAPGETSLVLSQLPEIVELARGLAKTRGPLFAVVPTKFAGKMGLSGTPGSLIKTVRTESGEEIGLYDCTGEFRYGILLRRCLQTKLEAAMKYLPHHAFHPALGIIERRFRPLLRYREDIFADQTQGQLYTYANEVNQAVEAIRADLLYAGFRKVSSEFIRATNENFRTLHAYVTTLFSKRATLWVIRLDLGYTTSQDDGTVKKHRESFLRYLRKNTSVGPPFGFSWKLEFSHRGSWHLHFLLFFEPVPTTTAEQIGNRLGEHWLSTTLNAQTGRSDGAFLNCNTINRRASPSFAVRRLGTGTVTHRQLGPGSGIIKAIQYMTQLDYYIKLRPEKGMKTFFGGNRTATEEKKSTIRGPRKPRRKFGDQFAEIALNSAMPRYQEQTEKPRHARRCGKGASADTYSQKSKGK